MKDKVRFFRYSWNKLFITEKVNEILKQSNKTVYIEPFCWSWAVLFNLDKEYKKYIINDADENIVKIYKTFKKIDYKDYTKELRFVFKKFWDIKTSKESYYEFRDWFNKKHRNTYTVKEGIYLHFLANSCINSLLRFWPNWMNQSFWHRFYQLSEDNFDLIKKRLRKTK